MSIELDIKLELEQVSDSLIDCCIIFFLGFTNFTYIRYCDSPSVYANYCIPSEAFDLNLIETVHAVGQG